MAGVLEIQIGRLARFLQKWSNVKAPIRENLGSEIVPTLSMYTGVENRYLDGWNRFGVAGTLAAVGAQVSGIQYRNPKGSNVVAVFEKIRIGNSSATASLILCTNGATTSDLTTLNSTSSTRFDPRGNPSPVILVSSQNAAAIAGLTNPFEGPFVGIVAGVTPMVDLIVHEEQEIPLLPGDALRFVTNAVNTEIRVITVWRERVLEESELT